ncbi:MAG TPA: M14 family zinc carboxypeptidase [Candidatus Thermoplasmatota archaeon]|nr:M14 family zinc carboxypeptidase [Candidatus Thermoplasmatota archaeon]
MLAKFLAPLVALVLMIGPVAALPGPGLNGTTTEAIPLVGRLFPEPLQTNDYIGYFEAVPSLEKLNRDFPDRIELFRVGKSLGWQNAQTGQREPQPVLAIEVTNEKSSVPFGEKIHLVFTCSIHGNEKGGREGCMRVAEDFAKGIGLAAEKPDLVKLLDYMVLSFPIPNTDGWTHDEPQYFPGSPSSMYTRGNANGTDLNRQWPTIGYLEGTRNHKTMNEPEIAGVAPWLKARYTNVWYAVDIHGMLNPADSGSNPPPLGACGPTNPGACPATATAFLQWLQKPNKGHFLLGLLSAAQLTQDEFVRQTRMAELVRERTATCPGTLGPTWCRSPSTGSWGGAFNFWGTSWETIGYTSSGSTSNFMMSPTGLNAPAATYEMSYNHVVCDGVYPGCGAYMNEFHVNVVRRIVESLMEAARTDFRVSLETGGARTAYLFNPKVVSTGNENGAPRASGGWSDENLLDDGWDILHNVYTASPMAYLRDMATYVREGDRPGVFTEVPVNDFQKDLLDDYTQLVIAGSTVDVLTEPQSRLIEAWVRDGGNLVLTDQSMRLLETLGAVKPGTVKTVTQYVGLTNVVDYSHPIAKNLLGYSRQTYDPIAIGIAQAQAPVWYVDGGELTQGGAIVGTIPSAQGSQEKRVNLGEVALGKGRIRFLGALLPDPALDQYTPYGVADYGVTYAGNQFFVNLLAFDQVYQAPPKVLENAGTLRKPSAGEKDPDAAAARENAVDEADQTPGFAIAAAFVATMAVVLVGRRRT